MSMRGTKFYHRRRLPSDVHRLTGTVEVWRSLRTDSLKIALRRLPGVAALVEGEIEHARLKEGLSVDLTLIEPLVDDQAARPATISHTIPNDVEGNTSVTLGKAYRLYLDDPTRSWSPTTREAYETSQKLAMSVIGEEVPIASISRAHCRDLLDVLRFLPTNANKCFPRLSPREAADRARLRGGIKIISAANANSLMSNVSSFLNWAVWLLEQLAPIAGRAIADLKPVDVLAALKRIEAKGKHETARRCRSFASRVFRYGVATGRGETDPTSVLRGALVTPKVTHHGAILDPKAVGELLRSIHLYSGHLIELPPSEWSIDYDSLDQGRDEECLPRSTSRRRL